MLKLITILAASIPIVLFVKNLFFRKSKVLQKASAEFRKQIDYLVWGILVLGWMRNRLFVRQIDLFDVGLNSPVPGP